MQRNVKHAIGLYMEGIRDGNYEQASDAHMGARYTQHSTGVRTGKEGFRAFFKSFTAKHTDRDMQIVRSFADGNLVFLHVTQKLDGGAAKWVTMDVFDSDAEGRLIEHWDVIEAHGAAKSGLGMVDGPTEPTESAEDTADTGTEAERTAANKTVVREYVKRVLAEGETGVLNTLVSEDLKQHASDIEGGRDGLRAMVEARALQCEFVALLMGRGDFVVTLSKTRRKDVEHATFDLYRVAHARIVEQWSVTEAILPRAQWGNVGKF